MIEVQVPKDVSVYESTLVGPLTSRQTVCLIAAAAVRVCLLQCRTDIKPRP